MASTIGRAGKQVFSSIVSPTNPHQGSISSSPTRSLQSQTLPNSNSSKALEGTNIHKLQSFKSQSLSRLESSTNDWTELEKTLQECLSLEPTEETSPYSPLRFQDPLNDTTTNHFSAKENKAVGQFSPILNQAPKLSELGNSHVSQSLNSQGFSASGLPSTQALVHALAVANGNSAALYASQQLSINSDVTSNTATKSFDKEELLAQLQQLRQQNEALTNEIEVTRIETQTQLEYERQQKLLMVANLEKENHRLLQQLMTEKLRSEQQLEKEKNSFIQSIKRMEEDKRSLEEKLNELEESKTSEIGYFMMEKLAMEKRLAELERKEALALQQLHEKSPEKNTNDNHQDVLLEQLQVMEQEKQHLVRLIEENLVKSQEENQKLTAEIVAMKENVQQKLSVMETDKLQLAEKLRLAEENVVVHTNLIQQQIEKQRNQTNEIVESLEREKTQLLLQQQQHSSQLPLPSSTDKINEDLLATPQTQIEALLQEKTLLQEKLKTSAEHSKLKVKEMSDLIQKRKKKLLMKNMNKIKQKMSNERLKEPTTTASPRPVLETENIPSDDPSNPSTVPSTVLSPSIKKGSKKSLLSPLSGALKSNRSLFDLMTELNQVKGGTSSSSGSKPSSNTGTGGLHSFVTSAPEEGAAYEIIGSHNANYINANCKVFQATGQRHMIERIDEKTFMDDDSSDEEDSSSGLTRKTRFVRQTSQSNGSGKEDFNKGEPIVALNRHSVKNQSLPATEEDPSTEDSFSDLPAPHSAAAAGDLSRLEMICNLDSALLESFDSVGRQPLFYAAAHGRENILDYILSADRAFSMLTHADTFGDTPLHAASAGGSVVCLERQLQYHQDKLASNPSIYQDLAMVASDGSLIDHSRSFVNIQNSTGMTPIHLAANGLCIEKLIEFGGDINLTDVHLRTPLFIACAINKESCVEYLIGYLDHSEEALLQKDYRGDTPLHAAACNGSVESLLLLLQCGLDPRIINDQGLKAIDLAIRNKHYKCKEILAEYHLHYCTSSEFDSVLFLATLEGHRMISQLKQFGGGNSNTSTPLHREVKSNTAFLAKSPLGANHTFQSMFSLRSNRTIKLQRYGPWIAYHDPGSHSVFWYNHENQKGQWETPEMVRKWRETKETQDSFDKTLQAKMSMRLKREGDWIQYTTEGGKTFYYNEKSCSFQWEDPFATLQAKSKISVQPSHSTSAGESQSDVRHNEPTFDLPSTSTERKQDIEQRTTEWKPYLDESTGHVFWYNHVTKVSQWENPFEPERSPRDNPNPQLHDLEAFPVYHENDLGI